MIPRITKGRSGYGSLAYDHGPGRRDEHDRPHRVAGNVAGRSWQQRAHAIDEHARAARPDVARPIHRTSLRLAPDDRALSEAEWRAVAESYVTQMGFERGPWEATRHGDEHLHLTVSRVGWDGQLASDGHDYARAQKACRAAERAHHLVDASTRYDRNAPQVSHGERIHAQRRGVAPERDQLREKLHAAEQESDGTRAGYERALDEAGVRYAANIASTGRMAGYRYGLGGHRDTAGEQVWLKGSQLGRDYSWTKTEARLSDRRQRAEQTPAGRVARANRISRGEQPGRERDPAAKAAPAVQPAADERLDQVLDGLHAAWTQQAGAAAQLEQLGPALRAAQADADRHQRSEAIVGPLREQAQNTREQAEATERLAQAARVRVDERAEQISAKLHEQWDAEKPAAREAAANVRAGPGGQVLGRLSGRRKDLRHDQALLDKWAGRWQPVRADLAEPGIAAQVADWSSFNAIDAPIRRYAEKQAEADCPDELRQIASAGEARQRADAAEQAHRQAREQHGDLHPARLAGQSYQCYSRRDLPRLGEQQQDARRRHDDAGARTAALSSDPAVRSQPDPDGWLAAARDSWQADYTRRRAQARDQAARDTPQASRRVRGPDRARGYGR
jgi:hypothetical protein